MVAARRAFVNLAAAAGRRAAVLGAAAALCAAGSGDPGVLPPGFAIERIAVVPGARELAVAPNGDLFAGTLGAEVVLVAGAQGTPAAPRTFVRLDDAPVAGVALDGDRLYLGAQFGVWVVPYRPGDRAARAEPRRLAELRPSGVASGHVTTSVAVAGGILYASVGSSCNACDPEVDDTRATIQIVPRDGGAPRPKARGIRNAIALAANPETGTLWAGVAGQDELAPGHPYEIFDAVGAHAGIANYGWPFCVENRTQTRTGADCRAQTVARVVFPAYSTPIGAAFYARTAGGAHAFPAAWRGGAFVTLHGSWHRPLVAPRVAFVPLDGDAPRTPVDWSDPNAQWRTFVGGLQTSDGRRIARPTGIAVGSDGSLFVADDSGGAIYRIRPRD